MKFQDDIERKIKIDFGEYSNQATKILVEAITKTTCIETDRVIRCIVFLANGDLNELNKYIDTAILDIRDIILWAEYEELNGKLKRLRDFNKTFEEY